MSYILDALRRADAERQRDAGQLPGLATPVDGAWTGASAADEGRRWRTGSLALLVALAGAGLATWWWRAPLAGPAAVPAPTPVARPQAPPPMVPQPLPQPLTAPTPAPAPVAVAPALPLPAPAAVPAPVSEPASAAVPEPAATPDPAKVPARPKARPPAMARAEARASAPAVNPAPPEPVPLAALPSAQRGQWPPLVVGGSMYSENPAHRMVILDGQLLHEGDHAGAGVVVERIRLRSAVLRAGTQRVEVSW